VSRILIVDDEAELRQSIWHIVSRLGHETVLAGSGEEALDALRTQHIDLIVTDPPYPAKFAPLWVDLGQMAMRLLRPGGILLALCGKIELLDRMDKLAGCGLHYGWMYVEPLPGSAHFTLAPHPRTAIGLSKDRRQLLLVVADGRREGVPGLTLSDLAALMVEVGTCTAVNLDGGGSSALWLRDRIVNQPSDGVERKVANHLGVVEVGRP